MTVLEYTICSFEVRFLAALASWLCRLNIFWLFLADKLVHKFWAAIFYTRSNSHKRNLVFKTHLFFKDLAFFGGALHHLIY